MNPELRYRPQTAAIRRALRGNRQAVALLGLLGMFSVAQARPLEVHVVGANGTPIAGAVVALRSTDSKRGSAAPIDAVMDQRDRAFVPHAIIVPKGSHVTFPNSDSVSHQVYSFSPANKFQLPLYRGQPNPPVPFNHTGIVTLGCNIHDQMRAYVFVTDAQYYGFSSVVGAWRAEDVAPGNYIAQIWHPDARDTRVIDEANVEVTAGQNLLIVTVKAQLPMVSRPAGAGRSGWDAY
jgi:plastocyanin